MNENTKENAKLVARIVGGFCGGFTVGNIVSVFVPGLGPVSKTVVLIGSSCIGGIIGDKCGEYLCNQVEQVCDLIECFSNIKKAEEI